MPPSTSSQSSNPEFHGVITVKQADGLASAQTPNNQEGLIALCRTLGIVPPKTSGGYFAFVDTNAADQQVVYLVSASLETLGNRTMIDDSRQDLQIIKLTAISAHEVSRQKDSHRKQIMAEVGDEALIGTSVELEDGQSFTPQLKTPDTDPRSIGEVTDLLRDTLQDYDSYLGKRAETATTNARNLGGSKNDFSQLQNEMDGLRQQDFMNTHVSHLETASRIVGVALQYVSQISLDLRNAQKERIAVAEQTIPLLDSLMHKSKLDSQRQVANFARQVIGSVDQYVEQNEPSIDLVKQLKSNLELLQGIAEYPTDESVEEVCHRVGEIADTFAGIIATYSNYASVVSQEKQKLQEVLERFAQNTA